MLLNIFQILQEKIDWKYLPPTFRGIGALVDCEYIKGITKVIEKHNEIYKNATKYIDDTVSESFDESDKIIMDKVSQVIPYLTKQSEVCFLK